MEQQEVVVQPYTAEWEAQVKQLHSFNLLTAAQLSGLQLFQNTIKVHGKVKSWGFILLLFLAIWAASYLVLHRVFDPYRIILPVSVAICTYLIVVTYSKKVPAQLHGQIAKFIQKTLHRDMKDIPAHYQRKDAVKACEFFVAVADGGENRKELAGFVGVEECELRKLKKYLPEMKSGQDKEFPQIAELKRMSVAPQWKKRGVGLKLVEKVAAFCREKGYAYVMLTTFSVNFAAMALYRKAGFVEVPYRMAENAHPGERIVGIKVNVMLKRL